MNEKILERIIENLDISLEEFFEMFDLTVGEVVLAVYESGLMDDEILEGMIPSDI
jgi:hypothetical protein